MSELEPEALRVFDARAGADLSSLRGPQAHRSAGNAGQASEGLAGTTQVVSCPDDVQVNARQEKAPRYLARHGKITRREYRNLFCVSARQSLRDLTELAEKGILIHSGKGRATCYLFPTARLVRN